MKQLIVFVISFLAVSSYSCAASPKWETYSCEYYDFKKDISLSGRCHMKEATLNGNFAYILAWPSGNKVTVEYVKSQSGFHIWKINGQPASGIEVSREHLKGFSHDLNQILEWQ